MTFGRMCAWLARLMACQHCLVLAPWCRIEQPRETLSIQRAPGEGISKKPCRASVHLDQTCPDGAFQTTGAMGACSITLHLVRPCTASSDGAVAAMAGGNEAHRVHPRRERGVCGRRMQGVLSRRLELVRPLQHLPTAALSFLRVWRGSCRHSVSASCLPLNCRMVVIPEGAAIFACRLGVGVWHIA